MKYTALIGNPVDHSVSDYLFRLFSEKLGLNYAHLKIKVSDKKELCLTLKSLQKLNFSGINVTLPYKVDAIKFLSKSDKSVTESGAVNTIKFQKGKCLGYNTDCYGFTQACDTLLKPIEKNDHVFIFGCGGAARAIIQQVALRTKNIYVFGRNKQHLEKVKKHFKNKIKEIVPFTPKSIKNKIIEIQPLYYINATPLGMIPDATTSPLSRDCYKYICKDTYFLDAVFNPYKTVFLKNAEKIGAKIAPGIYWMIYQGCIAFNLWNDTDLSLSRDEVFQIAKKVIKKLKK